MERNSVVAKKVNLFKKLSVQLLLSQTSKNAMSFLCFLFKKISEKKRVEQVLPWGWWWGGGPNTVYTCE
jgi:hypothetical protein